MGLEGVLVGVGPLELTSFEEEEQRRMEAGVGIDMAIRATHGLVNPEEHATFSSAQAGDRLDASNG